MPICRRDALRNVRTSTLCPRVHVTPLLFPNTLRVTLNSIRTASGSCPTICRTCLTIVTMIRLTNGHQGPCQRGQVRVSTQFPRTLGRNVLRLPTTRIVMCRSSFRSLFHLICRNVDRRMTRNVVLRSMNVRVSIVLHLACVVWWKRSGFVAVNGSVRLVILGQRYPILVNGRVRRQLIIN